MFKKNKKRVPTLKIGTHKKRTMFLWFILLVSITFAIYKNFTAVDQHTIHEKTIIKEQITDTNKIESFSHNFIKLFYSWNHDKNSLDTRNQELKNYLTENLQQINSDMIRSDIPTTSEVTSIQFWDIQQIDKQNFDILFSVQQNISEQKKSKLVTSSYSMTVHMDKDGDMVVTRNPTISSSPKKSNYEPKLKESDGSVDAKTIEEIDSFLKTFFKLYPHANEEELSYYVQNDILKSIEKDYTFLGLSTLNYSGNKKSNSVHVQILVKYIDHSTSTLQIFEYNLSLKKNTNWVILKTK